MKIIEPSVELWRQDVDWQAHVAKCARICYRSSREDKNEQLIQRLKDDKHFSMFRHRSVYWIVPIGNLGCAHIDYAAVQDVIGNETYCRYKIANNKYYISTNGHYYLEHANYLQHLDKYMVDELTFANTQEGHKIMRYTFKVVTQISTSRELNRVSPNNIAEQSTRYVYEDGTLCRPHWLEHKAVNVFDKGGENLSTKELIYINGCERDFQEYKQLVDLGMNRQDARGKLPLDTATVCAYTYFIDEWIHILNLRYHGNTGKPHPNAKIIASGIRDFLIDEGYVCI